MTFCIGTYSAVPPNLRFPVRSQVFLPFNWFYCLCVQLKGKSARPDSARLIAFQGLRCTCSLYFSFFGCIKPNVQNPSRTFPNLIPFRASTTFQTGLISEKTTRSYVHGVILKENVDLIFSNYIHFLPQTSLEFRSLYPVTDFHCALWRSVRQDLLLQTLVAFACFQISLTQ